MSVNHVQEICAAGKAQGMGGNFTEKMTSLGGSGAHVSNMERDFLRDARTRLGVNFQLYMVDSIVRDPVNVTAAASIGMLLPFEVAHWLFCLNPDKFFELFPTDRIVKLWQRAIVDKEEWFVRHPLYDVICAATDLSMFLPIHLFGDDGCLKKARAMGTVTWFPAVFTPLSALHSRIPTYVMARHHFIKDITESDLQRVIAWAFQMWMSGVYPSSNHLGVPWPDKSFRWRLASGQHRLCGGRTGVYVGTIGDQAWIAQHFRFSTLWNRIHMCFRCWAVSSPGALNFTEKCPFPERSTDDYLCSACAAGSPLSGTPGWSLPTVRGEAMHAGPLGALPDVAASALVDQCEAGVYGHDHVTVWQDRLKFQLNDAYTEFSQFGKAHAQDHSINIFSVAGFSLKTLGSWPFFKGKAHNCLVLARFMERKLHDHKDDSELALLTWQVVWAWVEWFDVCSQADPDFLEPEELKRLDQATAIMVHGHKRLANMAALSGKARWKLRQKVHVMYHINLDAQRSRRNPAAWWSFKEEEMMGRLAKIACATHGITLANRTLERWCVQFFNFMED